MAKMWLFGEVKSIFPTKRSGLFMFDIFKGFTVRSICRKNCGYVHLLTTRRTKK